jgi:hypothetical protein
MLTYNPVSLGNPHTPQSTSNGGHSLSQLWEGDVASFLPLTWSKERRQDMSDGIEFHIMHTTQAETQSRKIRTFNRLYTINTKMHQEVVCVYTLAFASNHPD